MKSIIVLVTLCAALTACGNTEGGQATSDSVSDVVEVNPSDEDEAEIVEAADVVEECLEYTSITRAAQLQMASGPRFTTPNRAKEVLVTNGGVNWYQTPRIGDTCFARFEVSGLVDGTRYSFSGTCPISDVEMPEYANRPEGKVISYIEGAQCKWD